MNLEKYGPNYIETREGWNAILKTFYSILEHYGKLREDFKILQIKEKFGTLRIYAVNSDEFIDGVIFFAENMSAYTCEICGGVGKGVVKNNWIRTRCALHE